MKQRRGQGDNRGMLYGRDDLVDRVTRSRAPLLLVTGDSGVGKSEVLARAQRNATDGVAPPVVTLDTSPGALQRGLLQALGSALANVMERRGAVDHVARRVEQAALAMARERATELAKAVGAELLAVARHRLSPQFGEGIADFIRHLRASADSAIGARISAATDATVAETLVALAAEVAELADDAPLLLSLDAAESMTSADRGVLGDLARSLPDTFRIRAGFATFSAVHRQAADELLAVGPVVQEQTIRGLTLEAVAEWLRDVGIDPALAERVCAVTDGYPLLVQSVIMDIRAGGEIEDAPLHKQFAAQTELAWNALDPSARACARRLAVLPRPLPAPKGAELCGMSLSEYADAVDRLRRGFILSTQVNGTAWFHNQRRAFVRSKLTGDEVADASSRAAELVLDQLETSNDLAWVQPCSELVADATALLAADSKLADAVELPRPQLAVCAALIELAEKQNDFVVSGDELLRHARAWFGARGDLVPALRDLAHRNLVALVEQDHAAAVLPQWSLMPMVTLQGRAAAEFDRLPVPSLTTLFFVLGLRRPLGRFERLAYGLGRPSWTAIAQSLFEPRKPIAEVRASAAFGEMNPALLVRGRIGGRPIYCAARYQSVELREEAVDELRGLTADLLGETLEVGAILPSPGPVVASDRFITALERASGRSIDRSVGLGRLKHHLREPFPLEDAMEMKAQTLSLLRQLCSPRERTAADLHEPTAWHWLSENDWVIQGAVRGTGEGSVRHTRMPVVETNDPYRIYRLIDAFDLPPRASLGRYQHAAGAEWKNVDPVMDIVSYVSEAMRDFNGTQQPLHLRFEADELRDALLKARRRALTDARALVDVLPILGERRQPPVPQALYLVVIRTDPTAGLFYGEYLNAHYEVVPSDTSEEQVHVALIDELDRTIDGPPEGEAPFDYFRRRANRVMQAGFSRDAADPIQVGGDAETLIARLLGYNTRDVRFVRTDDSRGEQPV